MYVNILCLLFLVSRMQYSLYEMPKCHYAIATKCFCVVKTQNHFIPTKSHRNYKVILCSKNNTISLRSYEVNL
jgi:hypothetical protein